MKKIFILLLLFCLPSIVSYAQSSTDYVILVNNNAKHICNPSYSTFCEKIVSYCPIFKNTSGRTIVGIKYSVDFIDSFGDIIVSVNDKKLQERIRPNSTNQCSFISYFKNNSTEYSQLANGIDNSTIKPKYQVKTIVFEDGNTINFDKEEITNILEKQEPLANSVLPATEEKQESKEPEENKPIKEITQSFLKSSLATLPVKSKTVKAVVYIDPTKWDFKKLKEVDHAKEYTFNSKDKYKDGILLTEQVEFPLESLKPLILDKFQARGAKDVQVINADYRVVNGIKVLSLQWRMILNNSKFAYYGYFYTSKQGTIQLITSTPSALFDSSKQDMEDFLNGLVIGVDINK